MAAKLAVQLWSIKDETEKDFIGALEKVAQMGYDGVEFAGFGDISAPDMKAALDRLGLKAAGAHVSLDLLRADLDGVIAYNKTIGNRYIVCPGAEAKTLEDCLALNREFEGYSKKIRENGMIFGYHNHAHEFVTIDGRYILDILLGSGDIIDELDTYWSEYAGVDTLKYIEKLGSRLPLVHLKDMKVLDNGEKVSTVYGEGILDNRAIIDASIKYADPEWFIIEWEAEDMPSLQAIEGSIKNLKVLLG